MDIRLASKSDAIAISELISALAKKYIAVSFNEEGVRNLLDSMTPTAIENYIEQGYRYHVGEIENKTVGVVATRDNSHLYHLFVDESYQGQGFASKLWKAALSACIASDAPDYFTVNSSLNAQAVYKGWGFVSIGGVREGRGVKDVPMELKL